MKAPLPTQERARSAALRRYHILDAQPEAAFDGLARLAAYICHTPTALITLVDTDHVWFKARVGMDKCDVPRDVSFCTHAVLEADVLIIPDTQADTRFTSNPLVTDAPNVRFYAGMPLVTPDGYAIGTLCVLDYLPRQLDERQIDALRTLAQQVIDQLELKRSVANLERTITQRDLAQAVLRESETRFRQLAENIREVFFLVSPDATQVIYISPAYAEIWGRSCESLYEQPNSFLDAVHPEDRAQVAAAFSPHSLPRGHDYNEYRVIQPDGSIRWVGGRTFPIVDEHGQVYRIAGVVDDVTERQQAEAELQRAHDELEVRVAERTAELERLNAALRWEIGEREQAEQALRESQATLERRIAERTADLSAANAELARVARLKDEFLASMSHELRTPLNAILGTYEVLHEQLYGPLTPRQTRALEHIESSSRHLLSLINDILDLSKVGAGKLELNVGPVPVATLCDASVQLARPQALQKGLRMSARCDPQVTTIQGDARRLKQVLINLLSNAVKFTPAGGAVGLEVEGDVEAGVARFTVWDTGIGIAPEHQARMFQPFTQLDSSLARQYEGTGLGLALVVSMVELHGGGIELESASGQGSRFTVALPWNERDSGFKTTSEHLSWRLNSPLALDENQDQSNQQKLTDDQTHACPSTVNEQPLILIAEDNEEIIPIIEDYLQARDYRTVVVRNGAEAIERARELHPALIVMDIQMPGMDGLEATRCIRADADLATTPIIAVTAMAMVGDRERCLEAGADSYMSKPVSLRGLAAEIETLISAKA